MLIGEQDLHARKGEDAEIYDDVGFEAVGGWGGCGHWDLSFFIFLFFPSVCEAEDALATAGKMPALHSACNVEEVDHGDDEHPDQVDEVPVQGPDFDVVGLVTAPFVAESHDRKGDHATDHVSQVQAGDCEEGRPKQGRPPGVLKETDAFANEC